MKRLEVAHEMFLNDNKQEFCCRYLEIEQKTQKFVHKLYLSNVSYLLSYFLFFLLFVYFYVYSSSTVPLAKVSLGDAAGLN